MIRCFVSFCVDDAPGIHVKCLLDELTRRTSERIHFDVYFDRPYGDSLSDFMKEALLEVPAVLLLLGPGYKRRIDNTQDRTGAYQEYDTIITRLEDSTVYSKPKVIPVIWAGNTADDAFPDLIKFYNPHSCNLNAFRAHGVTQEQPFLPKATLQKYSNDLDRIASELLQFEELSNPQAMDTKLEVFRHLLQPPHLIDDIQQDTIEKVLEIKYEHGVYDAEAFRSRYFTSTRFSRRLKERNVGLISGRKGSGKTTLVQIRELEAQKEDYFPVIDVEVENWNLHYLIQSSAFKQSEGDFQYVDLEVRFFDYVWASFVAFSMCISLMYVKQKNPKMRPSDLIGVERDVRLIEKLLREADSIDKIRYSILFEISVSSAKSFIQSVVDSADSSSEESFRLDVLQRIHLRNYLFSLFGVDFVRIRDAIQRLGRRRFLFCFDRFDTEIQQYRKEQIEKDTEQRKRRARREVNWLSSLTLFVEKTIRPDRLSVDRDLYEFFSWIKFLVVLPHDRVVELRQSQRDSVAGEAIEEIAWQPKELMTMLRKRIQVLYGIEDAQIDKSRNTTPLDRFQQCLALACPNLPSEVYILAGQRQHQIELFLNVLRHSFFRPRDILIHYASILSYYRTLDTRRRTVDVEAIREAISVETRTIVDFEFVGELRDTWTNIDNILQLFMGGAQILSAQDLVDKIGKVDFEFYDEGSTIREASKKIYFLYDIGFIGYRSKRQAGARKNFDDFTFSFLSRTGPVAFEASEVLKHLEFAIHPIFIERLFLVTDHKVPVLYFNWAALDRIDRID